MTNDDMWSECRVLITLRLSTILRIWSFTILFLHYHNVKIVKLQSRSNGVDPNRLLCFAVFRSLERVKDHFTGNVFAIMRYAVLKVVNETVSSQGQ